MGFLEKSRAVCEEACSVQKRIKAQSAWLEDGAVRGGKGESDYGKEMEPDRGQNVCHVDTLTAVADLLKEEVFLQFGNCF